MTLQSYTNNSEEVVADGANSSINSASTLSTDVYPLPFSAGQKEIVLTNDERALVGEVNTENFITPNTNICVTESSNIDIGNRTVFNRDVTIYQYIQGNNLPEIQNGAVGQDEVECNKTVTLISLENKDKTITNKYENPPNRHKIYLLISGITLITFLVIAPGIVFLPKNNKSDPTDITGITNVPEPKNTPVPGSDADVYIPRDKWGGVAPINTTTIPAAKLVVVKHTGGLVCTDEDACRARVREIQKEDMTVHNFSDISYNFLIGGDGKIYIGRGFHIRNEGRNDSMDIAFIGNFSVSIPTEIMLQRGIRVIFKGASPNEHAVDFTAYYVVNHNQTERTESPGVNLFKPITKWQYYSPKIYFNNTL